MDGMCTFEGRSALVTGAASGIGAACAKALDKAGARRLVLVDQDSERLAQLELGAEVERVAADVADPGTWSDLAGTLAEVDHAVVNAGIGAGGALAEIDFADWRRVMDVNLDGAFLTLAAAMRAMQTRGGSVVVVSSATAIKPVAGIGPYGIAKAAVAHMARIAALEGAPQGIRVNAIAPGGVDTAIWDQSSEFQALAEREGREGALKAFAATTPRGAFASADEIAAAILFLLGDAAANITGHVLVSDGGYTL